MPVLKFKDKDGVVKTTPGLKIVTEKNVINPSLNVHFGQTAPEDISKLWVKTDEYPNDVIISPKIIGEENIMTYGVVTLPSYETNVGVACVDDKMYLFGGSRSSTLIRKVDMNTGEITTLPISLIIGSSNYPQTIILDKKIYLFGSSVGDERYPVNVFDTETETVVTLKMGISGYYDYCTATSMGDVIYMFGGKTRQIFSYDTKTGTFITHSFLLPEAHNRKGVATVGTKIYMFCGYKYYSGSQNHSETNTIFIFDTTTGTTTISNVTVPYSGVVRPVAVGTDIYLLGCGTTIYVYDTLHDTINTLDISLTKTTALAGVCLYGTDIYLVGGNTSSANTIDKFSLQSPLKHNVLQIQSTIGDGSWCKLMKNPLLETSIKKVFIGNEDGYAEETDAYIYDYVPEFTKFENRQYTYNCVENSGGTSQASSINCSIGDLIIASIITRDTFTLSDGWTLISTSELNSEYVSGNGQRLSFAYKYAENTTETITVT